MSGLRVLVCGGRTFGVVPNGCPPDPSHETRRRAASESRLLFDTLDTLKIDRGIAAIIHGAARGADSFAGLWARRQLIIEEPYPADWRHDLNAAGMIRNQRMLTEGHPDLVVAFSGGRGTADMVARARKAGLEVIEVSLPSPLLGERGR